MPYYYNGNTYMELYISLKLNKNSVPRLYGFVQVSLYISIKLNKNKSTYDYVAQAWILYISLKLNKNKKYMKLGGKSIVPLHFS